METASNHKLSAAVWLLLLLLTPPALGKSMVRLSGVAGSSSTSSTLAWVPPPKDGSIPPYAVHVGQEEEGGGLDGSPVWCRGRWHNTWIPGELDLQERKCVIAFLMTVFRLDEFDILVSLGGAARVKWVTWDKHMAKPDKSLLSPNNLLVSVYDGVNGTAHTGNLGPSNRARKANLYDRMSGAAYEASKVLVLTEIEPVRYTLTDISLDTLLDSTKDQNVILTSTILSNEGDKDITISEETTYVISENQYWGRVKGTVTALPAVVFPPEGDCIEILWGIDTEVDRVGADVLKINLPAGTGVNATVIGKRRLYEAPYFASIRAYYEDEESRTWRINSFHSNSAIVMIIVQYSRPLFLHNGTILTGTPPTSQLLYELTTTTTTTATTTTTTTTTTPPPTTTTATTTTTTTTPEPPTAVAEVAPPGEVQLPSNVGSLSRDVTSKPSHYTFQGSIIDTSGSGSARATVIGTLFAFIATLTLTATSRG